MVCWQSLKIEADSWSDVEALNTCYLVLLEASDGRRSVRPSVRPFARFMVRDHAEHQCLYNERLDRAGRAATATLYRGFRCLLRYNCEMTTMLTSSLMPLLMVLLVMMTASRTECRAVVSRTHTRTQLPLDPTNCTVDVVIFPTSFRRRRQGVQWAQVHPQGKNKNVWGLILRDKLSVQPPPPPGEREVKFLRNFLQDGEVRVIIYDDNVHTKNDDFKMLSYLEAKIQCTPQRRSWLRLLTLFYPSAASFNIHLISNRLTTVRRFSSNCWSLKPWSSCA